jgi:hypothetical protein
MERQIYDLQVRFYLSPGVCRKVSHEVRKPPELNLLQYPSPEQKAVGKGGNNEGGEGTDRYLLRIK